MENAPVLQNVRKKSKPGRAALPKTSFFSVFPIWLPFLERLANAQKGSDIWVLKVQTPEKVDIVRLRSLLYEICTTFAKS